MKFERYMPNPRFQYYGLEGEKRKSLSDAMVLVPEGTRPSYEEIETMRHFCFYLTTIEGFVLLSDGVIVIVNAGTVEEMIRDAAMQAQYVVAQEEMRRDRETPDYECYDMPDQGGVFKLNDTLVCAYRPFGLEPNDLGAVLRALEVRRDCVWACREITVVAVVYCDAKSCPDEYAVPAPAPEERRAEPGATSQAAKPEGDSFPPSCTSEAENPSGELWNVYDYYLTNTGRLVPRGARMQPDEYHLVVNVWLRNARGEYLISQRSPEKTHPLCWEATGGSVLAGETSVQGAVREVEEELGIRLNPEDGVLICSGHRQYDGCPDILDVWVFNCDVPVESIVLQEGETVDARYASVEEIRRMVQSGEFIPMEKFNYLHELGI